jgi:hypothetical protein
MVPCEIVHAEAQLFQTGHVNVPAVLLRVVLMARRAENPDYAVTAGDCERIPKTLRNLGKHFFAVPAHPCRAASLVDNLVKL